MIKTIISIKNASYSYKGESQQIVGVDNISLDIFEGEFLVLLGHNGSGKSTLAKLLNGFLLPDSGEISVNGVLTTEEDKIYEIRSTVGMVFQNPDNQMVASIIEDDIAFGPENLGVPREEIISRVEWALKTVNMVNYRTHTPFKLSGGQKQRIAIASILAMLPRVLILDESTSMLDPLGRKEVMETIKLLNKQHKMTVILITHYMDEAIDADRVVIMKDGKQVTLGTPQEIFNQYEMVTDSNLELPVSAELAFKLAENGYKVSQSLTDELLVEAICQL